MIIPFDALKAVQASAQLLKAHQGKMTRLRLLKLLYIADRESIAETLRPITGDKIVAMDHGPVLSTTYKLIRGEAGGENTIWDKYIAREGKRDHVLVADPGDGRLSEYEIAKLRVVSAVRHGMTDYAIADETHKFPEWIKNQPPVGSKEDVSLHDVLDALGMIGYEERIVEEEASEDAISMALASVRTP